MEIDFAKVDYALASAYRAHLAAEDAAGDSAIAVTLSYTGDLASIEAAGFEVEHVRDGRAAGTVRFADLAAITALEQVEFLAAGEVPEFELDKALPDIRARASSAANLGSDGLWHAVIASGALTSVADATGKDVIVAVIDTGIDWTHPHFMSQLTPTKKTRIKRIWDIGLSPGALADCPDPALLVSTQPYGVEFDDTEIEAALNGGPALAHKDCVGHGTHCASIAAGGTTHPAAGDASRVGVAPEADIIAVKLLDNPSSIKFRTAVGFGGAVGFDRQFQDAVMYCLRTAKAMGKPVVISMSFGAVSAPGDGLDDDGLFVDGLVDPGKPPSNDHFPTRAIVCKSAGNNAKATRRQIAKITIPAGGEVIVPLQLADKRAGVNRKFKRCANNLHHPQIGASFWYRRTNPHTAITFALKIADQGSFTGDMGIGGHLERGFVVRPGPPKSIAIINPTASSHAVFVQHEGNAGVTHPLGGTMRRHRVRFTVQPKVSGTTVTYHEGIYEMRIRAPAGTEIFVACDVAGWAPGKGVLMGIAPTLANGNPLPADIDVTQEFSTTDPLGRHVLTVGAFDDTNGVAADPNHHHIASFSSRGPLRDYRTPAAGLTPLWQKPDISAPGVGIDAAAGVDTNAPPAIRLPSWVAGDRFVPKSGTSMATPMVAGVVALLLDKKPDLNITQVRTLLSGAAKPAVAPPPGAAGTNAYGSGRVDALDSHNAVP